jgi:DNA repair exonuclease SbcCD ATPase subunit
MLPLSLYLKNFMGHSESLIDCTAFSSALIVGKDRLDPRKSNGVGKSTIFNAMDYVLYNVAPTKTLDKIVREGAKKCVVRYDFLITSGTYRVERSRSKGAADLRLYRLIGDKWEDISEKNISETERELHKIIKITHKAFQNSVLFAQGDLTGLASASPQDRKSLLKEPLQISVYNKFEKIAKTKASEVLKVLEDHNNSISQLGKPLDDVTEYTKTIENNKQIIKNESDIRDQKQIELDGKKTEYHDLRRMVSSESDDTKKKLEDNTKKKKDLEKDIARNDRIISEREAKLIEGKSNLGDKLKEFNLLREELEVLNASVVRDEKEIQSDFDRVSDSEHRGRVHIAQLEADLNRYSKSVPEGDICLACLQQITAEHRENCEREAAAQRKNISETLDDYNKRLQTIISKKKKYQQELKEAAQYKINVRSVETRLENKKTEIQKMQELILEFSSMIKEAKEEKDRNDKYLNESIKQEVYLKEMLSKFSADDLNVKIDSVFNEMTTLESDINKLFAHISSLNTQLGVLEEKKRVREDDGEKLDALIINKAKIEKEYFIHQKVSQAFGSSGIPTLIIHTILDDLQLEANALLAELRPGIELQFHISKNDKDTLDLTYRIDGKERDWEQLGGGQKVFISLSLKLGLSIVIQRRMGVDIKFLELDEVDSPLDESGIDAYADVIKKWQSKFKIFVITHNTLLRQKFQNLIVVEHDGANGSSAYVANNDMIRINN